MGAKISNQTSSFYQAISALTSFLHSNGWLQTYLRWFKLKAGRPYIWTNCFVKTFRDYPWRMHQCTFNYWPQSCGRIGRNLDFTHFHDPYSNLYRLEHDRCNFTSCAGPTYNSEILMYLITGSSAMMLVVVEVLW